MENSLISQHIVNNPRTNLRVSSFDTMNEVQQYKLDELCWVNEKINLMPSFFIENFPADSFVSLFFSDMFSNNMKDMKFSFIKRNDDYVIRFRQRKKYRKEKILPYFFQIKVKKRLFSKLQKY